MTVVSTPDSVWVAWDFISTWAPASGPAPEPYALKIKTAKCKLFSFAPQRTLERWFSGTIPVEVERISAQRRDGGVRFLGSPVGHPDFCRDYCLRLVETEFRNRRDAIAGMKNKQGALALLRFSHVTRFSYILRTTPPEFVYDAAKLMDVGTRAAVDTILELSGPTALSDVQWCQVQLPIKLGGLGLCSAFQSCVPAFAGSVALCLNTLALLERDHWPEDFAGTFSRLEDDGGGRGQSFLTETLDLAAAVYAESREALEALKPHYVQPRAPVEVAPFVFPSVADLLVKPAHQLQKLVSRSSSQVEFHRLLDVEAATTPQVQRRLLSASGPMAGAWLTAPQVRADLRLSPAEFIDAVRYRLGVPGLNVSRLADPSLVCACGKHHDPADPGGLNSCARACGPSWIRRHDAIKSKIGALAKGAGLSVSFEERVGSGAGRARTDLTISDFVPLWSDDGSPSNSCKVQIDFAVTDPTGPTNSKLRCVQGAAATKYAALKMGSPGAACVHAPDIFIPAIIETYGLVHADLRKVLQSLAESQISQSVTDAGLSDQQRDTLKGVVVNSFYQLVSVVAVRGVVRCLDFAARNILARHGRKKDSRALLSSARAQCMIGGRERADASGLTEFG